jgi:hypothetical protein
MEGDQRVRRVETFVGDKGGDEDQADDEESDGLGWGREWWVMLAPSHASYVDPTLGLTIRPTLGLVVSQGDGDQEHPRPSDEQ